MKLEKQFRTLHWRNWDTGKHCRPYLIGPLCREFYIVVGKFKVGYCWIPASANVPQFQKPKTWGWDGFRYWKIILLKQELRLYVDNRQ